MGTIRLLMEHKEIMEARKAGIPEAIIGKIVGGFELGEKEKEIVRSKGKVYVLGHVKYNGETRIKPQLRDLPERTESRQQVRVITLSERRGVEDAVEEGRLVLPYLHTTYIPSISDWLNMFAYGKVDDDVIWDGKPARMVYNDEKLVYEIRR